MKFSLKKLETLLYRMVFTYLQTIRFVTIHALYKRTDRQTDRQNVNSNTVRMLRSAR